MKEEEHPGEKLMILAMSVPKTSFFVFGIRASKNAGFASDHPRAYPLLRLGRVLRGDAMTQKLVCVPLHRNAVVK